MRRHSILRKVTLVFSMAFVIMLICIMIGSFVANRNWIYTEMGSRAEMVNQVLEQTLMEYDAEQAGVAYINPLLHVVCKAFRLDMLTVYAWDPQTQQAQIRYAGAYEPAFNAWLIDHTDPEQATDPAHREMMRRPDGLEAVLQMNDAQNRQMISTRASGIFGWLYPISMSRSGELNAVLYARFSRDALSQDMLTQVLWWIIPAMLMLLAVNTLVILILRNQVTRPIRQMAMKMSSFAQDYQRGTLYETSSPLNEIDMMMRAYNKMADDITDMLEHNQKLTSERVETMAEFEVARHIQKGIVPESIIMREELFGACATTLPAAVVCGDFYDCFMIDDDHLAVVVGDVSGKGISAAMFMGMIKASIHSRLAGGMSPAEALNVVNDEICQSNPENMFATVFAGVLNVRTRALCYVNAGHNPPVILGDRPTYMQLDSGIALGLFEDSDLQEERFVLRRGSGLLLYTDGVTEARSQDGRLFGPERLLLTVERLTDPEAVIHAVEREAAAFELGAEQADDLTALAVCLCGEPEAEPVELPVDLDSQDIINEMLAGELTDREQFKRIVLVCEEVFTNIVSYSGAKRAWFSCGEADGVFRVVLQDDGAPFDPLHDKPRERDPDDFDQGGMGLMMIKQSARALDYARIDDKNVLTIEFDCGKEAEKPV